jgi:spore germination protein YaaH
MQRILHLPLAVLFALVLSSLISESALAAIPATLSQNTGTPVAQRTLGTVAGGSSSLQREVFGFALASTLSDPTVGYPTWDFSLVSTVAFFGLHVNDDGTLTSDSGMTVWNSSQLTGLLGAARSHGTKVVVTVILQDFSAGTPHMCAGLANRATTVSQTVAQVTAKGVDGVNIDYEGLNGTCPNGQSARSMMTDFAHQMRAALPAGSYLSVDTYASSAADPLGFFDVASLNSYVDSS